MSGLNQKNLQSVNLNTCPAAIAKKAEYLGLTCRILASLVGPSYMFVIY